MLEASEDVLEASGDVLEARLNSAGGRRRSILALWRRVWPVSGSYLPVCRWARRSAATSLR